VQARRFGTPALTNRHRFDPSDGSDVRTSGSTPYLQQRAGLGRSDRRRASTMPGKAKQAKQVAVAGGLDSMRQPLSGFNQAGGQSGTSTEPRAYTRLPSGGATMLALMGRLHKAMQSTLRHRSLPILSQMTQNWSGILLLFCCLYVSGCHH
jgi:hypothetical protein